MKNMSMLKRLAVFTLVFFSLFLLIDFVPDSVSSESNSSGSCSSDGCTPMEKLRNSILNKTPETQDLELPEDFGKNIKAEPKKGSSHPPSTKVKITPTSSEKITPKPKPDGTIEYVKTETDSIEVEVKKAIKGLSLSTRKRQGVMALRRKRLRERLSLNFHD